MKKKNQKTKNKDYLNKERKWQQFQKVSCLGNKTPKPSGRVAHCLATYRDFIKVALSP
jgi:hypothetical protein